VTAFEASLHPTSRIGRSCDIGQERRLWSEDDRRQKGSVVMAGRGDEGQGLAEYALILALIAMVAITALLFLGPQISSMLSQMGAMI
jgi:Flp pilus assembly pilin Flp